MQARLRSQQASSPMHALFLVAVAVSVVARATPREAATNARVENSFMVDRVVQAREVGLLVGCLSDLWGLSVESVVWVRGWSEGWAGD